MFVKENLRSPHYILKITCLRDDALDAGPCQHQQQHCPAYFDLIQVSVNNIVLHILT